ncbi:MAG: hypothetical protein LBJ61_00510 [Deltaproteobacteria bacterium]|jgi:hypothetical protein|nr:hypothetical protein [Deltaproteobacteria bacterium]
METEYPVDEKLLNAFHLMYDCYPEPVQLAHVSRTILAVNPAGLAAGKAVGLKCSKIGPPEGHRGCLATHAVKELKAKWRQVDATATLGRKFVTFWLPLEGYPNYYVHFSCGSKIDYGEKKPD